MSLRENTRKLARLALRSFWENRAQNAASLINFCAHCVALVAFIGRSRTGTREHLEIVFDHDERVVLFSAVIAGQAACVNLYGKAGIFCELCGAYFV